MKKMRDTFSVVGSIPTPVAKVKFGIKEKITIFVKQLKYYEKSS